MIKHWLAEIGKLTLIKKRIADLDGDKMFPFHLPNPAATEADIMSVEDFLGHTLDNNYKQFLKLRNGWRDFFHSSDLFGTIELKSRQDLDSSSIWVESLVFKEVGISIEELLPISISKHTHDVFFMARPFSRNSGKIFWFCEEEIDRYESFDDYFMAMSTYTFRTMKRLEAGWPQKTLPKGWDKDIYKDFQLWRP